MVDDEPMKYATDEEARREIALLEQLVKMFEPLDRDAKHRVFRYLINRFALSVHRIV